MITITVDPDTVVISYMKTPVVRDFMTLTHKEARDFSKNLSNALASAGSQSIQANEITTDEFLK